MRKWQAESPSEQAGGRIPSFEQEHSSGKRATAWRQRVAHGVSRGTGRNGYVAPAGAIEAGGMSGSFAAPRLQAGNNPSPHGSRRGLLSDAAPQLARSNSANLGKTSDALGRGVRATYDLSFLAD